MLAGAFDRALHASCPTRVLVTAMQSHQRYLPLTAPDGARYPGFLTVVNSDAAHDDAVRAGNERVLAGRLDDAAFSSEQDLAARAGGAWPPSLERITFHARAGSLADKTARIRALVDALLDGAVGGDDAAHAREAARLAKADQASTMVREFAELEGYVGERVRPRARACRGRSRGPSASSSCPTAPARALPQTACPARCWRVADKLDALVDRASPSASGRPGSRDPYGLRRAAAGVVAIALRPRLARSPGRARGARSTRCSSAQGADLASTTPTTVAAVE